MPKKYVSLSVALLLMGMQVSVAESLPSNCVQDAFEYYNGKLYLNAVNFETKQRLFVVRNVTDQPMVVSHVDENAFMDIGWKVTLEPGKWSALAVDSTHFGVICSPSDDSTQKISCEEVLELCAFSEAKFDLSSQGSYWVAENTSLKKIYSLAGSKGVRVKRWW